jgi:demethylmenaquinone methyltransferase/2-methoxy-6-polyprenyl-1,4-benzoquinol methylase
MSTLFNLYFFGLPPLIGQLLTGDRAAYTYLPRSVRQFMDPEGVVRCMYDAGFREVQWMRRALGTAVIYVGLK